MAAKTKAVEEVAVDTTNARSHGGTTNDEKYLFCNLKNVKETFVGRAQSVEHNADLPNGSLTWLGSLKVGETHIFTSAAAPTGGLALSATHLPWVMFRPEITPYEDTRMDYVMGHFRMKADKPHPAWQLNLLDKIEYSKDYFTDTPSVGDFYPLVYQGGQFTKDNGAGQGTIGFQVVSTHEVQTPIAYSNQNQFPGMPESKIMYTLQLVAKA